MQSSMLLGLERSELGKSLGTLHTILSFVTTYVSGLIIPLWLFFLFTYGV